MRIKLIIFLSLLLFSGTRAIGESEKSSDSEPSEEAYKPVSSSDAMLLGSQSGSVLCRAAKYQLQLGNIDKSISLVRMSLSENDDDEETHFVYAQALEKKIKSQETRDPELYRQCLKEWLICLRQETGQEKLATKRGLSLPKLVQFYGDEDGTVPAKQHLIRLAGRLPKLWETDARYLDKVTSPSTQNVTGKLVNKREEKNTNTPN